MNIEKQAQANCLKRIASAILGGIKVGTKFLPENSGELGFTSMGNPPVINVAWWEDNFFKPLNSDEHKILRMGIGAHELLHQVFTNFEYTNSVASKMSRSEAGIFMAFANTIEDPAIEYMAPAVMGGWLLDSLRFSIRHIYALSQGIESFTNAFSQLINALINFGDMGIVKGKFTFPESYEYFKKIAPIYNKAIVCPNSIKRINYAKECMEITRPLWEDELKKTEFMDKLMEELLKEMEKSGLHLMDDEEAEQKISSMPESDISDKRKIIISMIEDSTKENDGKTSGDNSKDSGVKSSKEETDTSAKPENGGKTSSEEKDNSASKICDDSDCSDNLDNSGQSDNSDSSDDENDEMLISELTMSPKEATKAAMEEYEVSSETLDSVKESIKEEEKKISISEKEDKHSCCELPDYSITGKTFKSATCINTKIVAPANCSNLYNEIIAAHRYEISNLTKRLKKIFESEREESARTTSGSYNILRGSVGTSARIFDKRRDKGNAKDISIFLCVDLSGSMAGQKEKIARETSIIFAEALTSLNVPYYIMGFSADKAAQAVHYHFVDWSNKKSDRQSLACMKAGGNNFDGYSIRYSTEILKNFNSRDKLLFVISDGEPACYTYKTMRQGISDTTDAIKESRKSVKTFGIAFGNGCNPETLQNMYGTDFIHCSDISLLTNILTKKLEKMLKKGRD